MIMLQGVGPGQSQCLWPMGKPWRLQAGSSHYCRAAWSIESRIWNRNLNAHHTGNKKQTGNTFLFTAQNSFLFTATSRPQPGAVGDICLCLTLSPEQGHSVRVAPPRAVRGGVPCGPSEGCCCGCVERMVMVTRAEAGWHSRGTQPCMARRGHGATQSPGHVPGTRHTAWHGAGRLPVRAHHGGMLWSCPAECPRGEMVGKGIPGSNLPEKAT